ncbi:hypothetical protein MCEMSEM29_01951 [Methylophilaceae bacterium]|jgi:hypothetical protein
MLNRIKAVVALMLTTTISISTAMVVSGIIIFMHNKSRAPFFAHIFLEQWAGLFMTVWPIAFITILTVAPMVNGPLNLIVKDH